MDTKVVVYITRQGEPQEILTFVNSNISQYKQFLLLLHGIANGHEKGTQITFQYV